MSTSNAAKTQQLPLLTARNLHALQKLPLSPRCAGALVRLARFVFRHPLQQESQNRISDFLYVSWNVVFYITNAQGWFLLQVQQAYNDAGQFTRWGRFRQALKENVAVSGHAAHLLSLPYLQTRFWCSYLAS